VKISKSVNDTAIGKGEKNKKKRLPSIAQKLELFDNRNKPT
jgi:hypothetical protein